MSARRPWSRRPTRCAARSRRPSSSPSAATPCSRACSRSGSARGSAITSTRAPSSSSRSCRRPRRARPTGGRSASGRADARESLLDDHHEALGALRALVGKEIRRPEPYVEVATRDAIRHWAHGIGDRNPLWAAARLAPPTILFAMDRIVSGYVTGLPGIHAMYAGTDFRWRRAVREGDRVLGRSVLLDLEEKASTFARRAIRQ